MSEPLTDEMLAKLRTFELKPDDQVWMATIDRLQAEVARLNGQRCVSCRWFKRDGGLDFYICTHESAPIVAFDGLGDPTTFGCPFWEAQEVRGE